MASLEDIERSRKARSDRLSKKKKTYTIIHQIGNYNTEDFSEFEAEALDEENLNLEDTMTLLSQYVDSIETEADKDRLKSLLKTLYVEAQDYAE